MENFTKNSLKAAVAKYGPLLESASEAVLIEELKKDERAFTDEQIAEIVAAIKEPAATAPSDEQIAPEWAEQLLASNQAVIESNAAVIESIAEFKHAAVEFLKAGDKSERPSTPKELDIDEDAEYVVADGKSFRDSKNFSKEYTSGEDVSHLDNEVLKRLLNQGLITEA